MRHIETKRRFERIYQKVYPLRLSNFRYENIVSLGKNSLSFTGGISVICGANGVGKSTILRAIYCGLTRTTNPEPRFGQPRLISTVQIENREIIFDIDYSQNLETTIPDELQVEIIDPSKSAIALVDFFSKEQNLEEWKESVCQ